MAAASRAKVMSAKGQGHTVVVAVDGRVTEVAAA